MDGTPSRTEPGIIMRVSRHTVPGGTVLAALAVLALGVAGCESDPSGPGPAEPIELPRALSASEVAVIDASNGFAFDLLGQVAGAETGPNVFLSPLSASMALGMTLNGTDGDTWTQMRDMLGFEGLDEPAINRAYSDLLALLTDLDPAVELGIGNSVWARTGTPFHQDFLDRVREHFDAQVQELDFADPGAPGVINAWVEDVTNGRIEDMVESIPGNAIMYLINAIYFNGDWRNRFDEDRTRAAAFTRADGSTVQVDMMQGEVGYRTFSTPEGGLGVELPYGGDAFAAVAVLPPAGQGVREFVAGIDADDWRTWTLALDGMVASGDEGREGALVRFPKLELEYERLLNDDLQALGMTDAFDRDLADFTRLTPIDLPAGEGPPWVKVSKVKQKSFLKVDERGTEAAAATSVEIVVESAPMPIAFDRPFLFAIRERLTGTILFMGVIGDPTA